MMLYALTGSAKRGVMVTLLLLTTWSGGWAKQTCKCTIFPFIPDPPCFSRCCPKLLQNISPEAAHTILGLSMALAKEVSKLAQRGYDDLSAYDRAMRKDRLTPNLIAVHKASLNGSLYTEYHSDFPPGTLASPLLDLELLPRTTLSAHPLYINPPWDSNSALAWYVSRPWDSPSARAWYISPPWDNLSALACYVSRPWDRVYLSRVSSGFLSLVHSLRTLTPGKFQALQRLQREQPIDSRRQNGRR